MSKKILGVVCNVPAQNDVRYGGASCDERAISQAFLGLFEAVFDNPIFEIRLEVNEVGQGLLDFGLKNRETRLEHVMDQVVFTRSPDVLLPTPPCAIIFLAGSNQEIDRYIKYRDAGHHVVPVATTGKATAEMLKLTWRLSRETHRGLKSNLHYDMLFKHVLQEISVMP